MGIECVGIEVHRHCSMHRRSNSTNCCMYKWIFGFDVKYLFCLFQKHIKNGCLSGIYPGHGTSIDERLHRKLNSCCAAGVPTIGPQLLISILTVIFYWHKSHEGKRHQCNSEVVPVLHPTTSTPPEAKAHVDTESHSLLEKMGTSFEMQPDDQHAARILDFVCSSIESHQKTVKKMLDRNQNRLVSLYDILRRDDLCIDEETYMSRL